jgi:hypothetical protein
MVRGEGPEEVEFVEQRQSTPPALVIGQIDATSLGLL